MPGTRIAALGKFLPERVVTNQELEALLDTTDEWIFQRTGIRERRWTHDGVGSSDLGLEAAKSALSKAGVAPGELDLIIFATLSPDITFPGCSCLLQAKLGAPGVGTLDLRNQCTGFVYGLSVADAFIRSGFARKVLLVGAETHSSGIEMAPRGRDVTPLFGDGAGAAVLVATEGESRLLDFALHADGRNAPQLCIVAPSSRRNPRVTHEMLDEGLQWPHMEGRAVFKHAVELLPQAIHEVLRKTGHTLDEVDLLVPHQANQRINESVAKRLGFPMEKVMSNIEHYGNTTAASIPIALCEAEEQGRLKTGDLVLLAAFGSGFTWGASLLRW